MPRYKLTIEYDGTDFCGWQRQKNGVSVQEILEQAVFKFTKEETKFVAAGRTDAGVHALGQVVHFDLNHEVPTHTVIGALNYHVKPFKIAIISAEIVDQTFHARFSCISRSYRYRILNRPAPTALFANYIWHIKEPLAVEAMHSAAQILIGKHDLSSFRSAHCQAKSALKSIDTISVSRLTDDNIEIFVCAPSFMHNQVRIMTGCLVEIGLGKWSKEDFQRVILARDRKLAAQTAPAHGLYFYQAHY
jgi:tRNA pseudouridine38-40 synthase